MGSEQNDSTSFSRSELKLCANGCGFFGTAANMNLCSKCYRDFLLKESRAASAKAAFEKSLNPNKPNKQEGTKSVADAAASTASEAVSEEAAAPRAAVATRCFSCKKKVGLTGFKCKCGSMFCGQHRYPEKHECGYDFKGEGKDAIAKANPVVKADKVERI